MSGPDLPPAPSTYQFQNQGGADTGAYSGIQRMSQGPNYGSQAYDAFAPGLFSQAGSSGYNPADTVAAGNYLTAQGAPLGAYGYSILDKALDPQGDLYNRTAQNVQDQTRAGLAARGLGMTPYGAGVEGKAMSDFNIDWQNQAINRAAQGSAAASPLFSQMDKNIVTGQQLAAGVPMQQAQLLQMLQQGGLGAYALPQQVIQNYLSYLQGGQGADNTAVNNYKAQASAALAEQQNSMTGLSGLGKMLGMGMMML